MSACASDADLERLRDELLGDIDVLIGEAELVYAELVLPRWGSAEYHGFPRTLYGYVMASFSMVDLLSHHRYSDASQTTRMRKFLQGYMGVSADAAAVAVQLWRHTLMHTANPRPLIHRASGRTFRWLLHWREHLPRDQHMQFQRANAESILNVGLMYLLEDLAAAGSRAFADATNSSDLRERFLRVSRDLSAQSVRF
jgi:hypothetical protein